MSPSRTCRFGVVLLSCVSPSAFAATIVVDPSGGGAFTAIQPALDAALDGDTVLVEPGEYVISEPIDFNRLHDPGDPGSPPVKDLILRSEDGAAVTTIRMGVPVDEYWASVVVFHRGETSASLLEGFTVTGGKGWGAPLDLTEDPSEGGGILCLDSSPVVRDCTITGNTPTNGLGAIGGGVSCAGGSPVFDGCTISGNTAKAYWSIEYYAGFGGGVCVRGGSPTFIGCKILENWAEQAGGGIWVLATAIIVDCEISGNGTSLTCGGGVCCEGSVTMSDCTIVHNESWGTFDGESGYLRGGSGGGVCTGLFGGGFVTLDRCLLEGNSAKVGFGGGFLGTVALTDCTVVGNSARGSGGGGVTQSAVTRSTIAGNSASTIGGVVLEFRDHSEYSAAPLAALTDSIVWDNPGGSLLLEPAWNDPTLPRVTYSCVEGPTAPPGTGNINTDPRFCGWGSLKEVHVDAARPGPGDGSAASPFPRLTEALAYSVGLSSGSPCLGAASGGGNMGASNGVCGPAGEPTRLVRLAAGRYDISGLGLAHRASLVGAGADETAVEGTVWGLETDAVLARVTVTKGTVGGVVVSGGESPTILSSRIVQNWAFDGGGVSCATGSAPRLLDCEISGNRAYSECMYGGCPGGSGGGVQCGPGSAPALSRCIISGNLAEAGGGVYCGAGSAPTLTSCLVFGNRAYGEEGYVPSGGGGLFFAEGSSPVLTDCTIWDNVRGGGWGDAMGNSSIACDESGIDARLNGCIVWTGSAEPLCADLSASFTGSDPLFVEAGTFDYERYSDVDIGGRGFGPGYYAYPDGPDDGDPVYIPGAYDLPDFIVEAPDYHLQAGSPCVDAADPASAPAFDLEGWSRPCGAGPDIGAYERGGCRDTLVLDDGDPGTYAVGRWPPSGGTPAWGDGCVYGYEDGSSYTFDFAVPGSGTWAVELWWTTWPSRLTDVPVEIEHAGGISTVLVDQQEDGGAWNRLGTYTFEGRAVVRILAATGGSTCADAARLVPVEDAPTTELILDNGGPGTSSVGSWAVSGGPNPYGANSVYSGVAGTSYRYELALPSAGSWEVSLWWTQWSSRLGAVPVEIQHAGGTATVYVDQRANGGKWNVLGTWTFSGTAVITIRSLGGGSTCADAVRLVSQ